MSDSGMFRTHMLCVWPATVCVRACVHVCVSLGFRFVPNMGLVKERGPNLFPQFSGSCTNSRPNLFLVAETVPLTAGSRKLSLSLEGPTLCKNLSV